MQQFKLRHLNREPNTVADQGDIERAQQGKDVWNAWAEENPGAEVDFSRTPLPQAIDFGGFVFPGRAKFEDGSLPTGTSFANAIFRDIADFKVAQFVRSANFQGATFEASAEFGGARFL